MPAMIQIPEDEARAILWNDSVDPNSDQFNSTAASLGASMTLPGLERSRRDIQDSLTVVRDRQNRLPDAVIAEAPRRLGAIDAQMAAMIRPDGAILGASLDPPNVVDAIADRLGITAQEASYFMDALANARPEAVLASQMGMNKAQEANAARLEAARIGAGSRQNVAETNAGARRDVAATAAGARRYTADTAADASMYGADVGAASRENVAETNAGARKSAQEEAQGFKAGEADKRALRAQMRDAKTTIQYYKDRLTYQVGDDADGREVTQELRDSWTQLLKDSEDAYKELKDELDGMDSRGTKSAKSDGDAYETFKKKALNRNKNLTEGDIQALYRRFTGGK